ncbi:MULTISPECIES: GNAT family N-acetyltransferase [unclassified Luteococcus]|uniref:GNAT family N-acetyltransferase n=1 Tax=unclassified Luteococcus TaxID=2639923 RepID=UPI00313BD10B
MSNTADRNGWHQSLTFTPMTLEVAQVIADDWKYPAPYDFYDATADMEDYKEFITPTQWPDRFWQVRHGEDLVGFFTADSGDDDRCEISLGLRPDLTGGGHGLSFLHAALALLETEGLTQRPVMLSVAAFNQRAIKVYEAAGFTMVRTYAQPTNGSTYDFIEMELRKH